MKEQLFTFKGTPFTLMYTTYANNDRTALVFMDADTGEHSYIATVNLANWFLQTNHVLIKNWAENTGILERLEELEIVRRTGNRINIGWVVADECKLLLTEEQYHALPYAAKVGQDA